MQLIYLGGERRSSANWSLRFKSFNKSVTIIFLIFLFSCGLFGLIALGKDVGETSRLVIYHPNMQVSRKNILIFYRKNNGCN